MNYYDFFSENKKAYTIRKYFLGFIKYAVIFALSFALSFFLIYNAKFNESDKIKEMNDEITELKKQNKELAETVDSLNIQIDNVKKFYDEERKAKSNLEQGEVTSDD